MLNTILNRLQSGQPIQDRRSLVMGPACAVLCERAANEVACALAGDPEAINRFLRALPDQKPMVTKLLGIGSPSDLCGTSNADATIRTFLSMLRVSAGRKAWHNWARQWRSDPLLKDLRTHTRPWWRFALKRKRSESDKA